MWDRELEQDIVNRYRAAGITPMAREPKRVATAAPAGAGFVTEVSGKLILTAPARSLSVASDLPQQMQDQWEKASTGNPYMQWIQGRFVEAEKANHNGAFWSTADLQFGEMSVKHGPLNWLHEGRKVVGTIADNALIQPAPPLQAASSSGFITSDTTNAITISGLHPQPRPYIAAVSAVWQWLYPDEAKVIAQASDRKDLYYSMECVAQGMQCVASDESKGCGETYDYFTAMGDPSSTCKHIAERTASRRMVSPSFLGGAVIVPPTKPGWGEANAAVMQQAASLAADVAPADANTGQWELLMGAVLAYAAS
jgi:hypothetical protein